MRDAREFIFPEAFRATRQFGAANLFYIYELLHTARSGPVI